MVYVIKYWNSQLKAWVAVKDKHQEVAIFKTKKAAAEIIKMLRESLLIQTRIVPIRPR